MQKITIKILDMTCASCAASVKKYLEKQPGIISADINVATEKGVIEYNEEKINEDKIKKAVVETGYRVAKKEEQKESEDHGHMSHVKASENKLRNIVILSFIFSVPIFIRMFWPWSLPGEYFGVSFTNWAQLVLATVIVFIFGWQFHVSAWNQAKKISTNMDSLISLGTLTAYFYSLWAMTMDTHVYFETAAMITTLILLGKYLELKSKNRASRAMKKLMELAAQKARLVNKNGEEKEVDIDQIRVGDTVLVKAGEKIPLDGAVIKGESNIDESMLTGESLPVFKQKNGMVFGGTINQDGVLYIKISQIGENTMLAQIIKTVEEAQMFKPPMQRLADKISSIFVPVVISIAIFTFLGWYLFTGNLSLSIINAVAVLIISCPCALGIATPIAVMVGTSVGAKQGVLIKDGESFEKIRKIKFVVFDKTGTLTKGKPKVQKVVSAQKDFSKEKIIKIAASLAIKSGHPLSKAIYNLAKEKNIELADLINFKEISGRGLMGECQAHQTKILIGNFRLLKKNKINLSWADKFLEDNKKFGGSILFVVHGEKIIGAILIADEIKDNAKKVIKNIKDLNLIPVIISGDSKNVTQNVAKELDIDNYLAEVLPQGKQEEIKKMQKNNDKVIFIGDGINDAPSLAQADIGIAMGGGTDIAKESGKIIIVKDDLEKVVSAIKLSQKTFQVIKQNLFWAFFYNVIAIPLAIFGFVNPMVGALAMGFSDVTVISNSLRIYKN